MPEYAIELEDLRAGYGTIEVLHGMNFRVPKGSVTALLGANGAGKTTTLSVIAGRLPATAGSIRLAGHRTNAFSTEELARLGLCSIPEGRGVFPRLTVEENLKMMTYLGLSFSEITSIAFERFPRLKERRKQLAGTMSGGEQQMLALARGLATNPAILLLDELSMGLAPLIVEELFDQVRHIAATGVSVLVVEQFVRTVLPVADRAIVVAHGRVVAEGTPQELEGDLAHLYLGVEDTTAVGGTQ